MTFSFDWERTDGSFCLWKEHPAGGGLTASGIPLDRVSGTLDWTCPSEDDGLMDEVSAAFGLFGREDSLRVVNDVLVSGGSVVAIGDPGAGKSTC
jgi:hypothetical protein